MNVCNEGGSLIEFKDPWPLRNQAEPETARSPDPAGLDYYRSRELAERSAAKNARSTAARCIHQTLAQAYARMIRKTARAE